MDKKSSLHHMTYEEAREYFSGRDLVILPVGSVEQHGPANPLGTDMLIAEALAQEVASRSGVISLPVIPFGISFHHMGFPGTITVGEDSLGGYMLDVMRSLSRWGVKKVLIVNGHGGNLPTLQLVARRAMDELGVRVYVYQWWTSSSRILEELFEEDERGHASGAETSLNMHLHPELVRRDRLTDERPRDSFGGKVYRFVYTHEMSDSGVFGRQSSASPERGSVLFERLVEDLLRVVKEIEEGKLEG